MKSHWRYVIYNLNNFRLPKKKYFLMMTIIKRFLINTKNIANQDFLPHWRNDFKKEDCERQDGIENVIIKCDWVRAEIHNLNQYTKHYNTSITIELVVYKIYFNISEGPKNCRVGDWGPWDTCSKSCGIGEQRRSRKVLRHPKHGGKHCPELEIVRWCGSARNECRGQYFDW